MLQLDNKIASALMGSLTLEELEAMVELKKQERNKLSAPLQMTEEQKIKNYCRELLKKKLYAPKYK
jgi:hypothetical protein